MLLSATAGSTIGTRIPGRGSLNRCHVTGRSTSTWLSISSRCWKTTRDSESLQSDVLLGGPCSDPFSYRDPDDLQQLERVKIGSRPLMAGGSGACPRLRVGGGAVWQSQHGRMLRANGRACFRQSSRSSSSHAAVRSAPTDPISAGAWLAGTPDRLRSPPLPFLVAVSKLSFRDSFRIPRFGFRIWRVPPTSSV